jgi:hypothetical protein
MNAMTITELKDRRETYGHDDRAINKHSIRVYQTSGVKKPGKMEFLLRRTLDGVPPFFSLCYFKSDSPLPTYLNVKGVQYWGKGLSWPRAEQKAYKAIAAFLAAR